MLRNGFFESTMARFRLAIPFSLICVGLLAAWASAESKPIDRSEAELKQRVQKLIEQLGSEHYASRRQAQDELQEIGVPALDLLQEACFHLDPQIANSARYLVRSSTENWANENDLLEVQKLLRNYSTGDVRFRSERIQRLSALKQGRGLSTLLRIARFEVDGRLSRRAALFILQHRLNTLDLDGNLVDPNGLPVDPIFADQAMSEVLAEASPSVPATQEVWMSIAEAAKLGKNHACLWLAEMAAVELKQNPIDPGFWTEQVTNELKLLQSASNETSRELCFEFTRLVSEQLQRHGYRELARDIAAKQLDIKVLDRERDAMAIEFCEWALARGFAQLVIDKCSQLPVGSTKQYRLDYLRAEAHQNLNELDQAKTFADRAFQRGDHAVPIEIPIQNRYFLAQYLSLRKQFEWAEREYRVCLDGTTVFDREETQLVNRFSFFLADSSDHAGAAAVMQPLWNQMESDPTFAKELDEEFNFRIVGTELSPVPGFSDGFRARLLYYRALDKIKQAKLDEAKEDLRTAWKLDRSNIDVAITMWKNKDDQAWNEEARQAVEDAKAGYEKEIPVREKEVRENGPQEYATLVEAYAESLNSYAWLLVCTEQQLEIALDASKKSCQLNPDAAHLDTLARCYFKVGNVEEAIRIQRRAVALDPAAREISRALDEFRKARPQ